MSSIPGVRQGPKKQVVKAGFRGRTGAKVISSTYDEDGRLIMTLDDGSTVDGGINGAFVDLQQEVGQKVDQPAYDAFTEEVTEAFEVQGTASVADVGEDADQLPSNAIVDAKLQGYVADRSVRPLQGSLDCPSLLTYFLPQMADFSMSRVTSWKSEGPHKIHLIPRGPTEGSATNPKAGKDCIIFENIPGGNLLAVQYSYASGPSIYESPQLIRSVSLPDRPNGASAGGFTITGRDKITRGKWAGCWLVGNDGRAVEGDGTPYDAELVILSPDFTRILAAHSLGFSGSVQGVAVDYSGVEDSFWVTDPAAKKIRHYDQSFNEITGDVIDYAVIGTDNPNALAYDGNKHALWIAGISAASFYLVSCDSSAVPRVLRSVSVQDGVDHFHFDALNGYLYFTTGSNGEPGAVRFWRADGPVGMVSSSRVIYYPLTGSEATESVYLDRVTGELSISNDGAYHATAKPALNLVNIYKPTKFLAESILSEVLCLTFIARVDEVEGSSVMPITVGTPEQSNGGLAITRRDGSYGFYARNRGAGSSTINATFPAAGTVADENLVTIVIDAVANTMAAFVNGMASPVTVASGSMAALVGPLEINELAIGGAFSSGGPTDSRRASLELYGLAFYSAGIDREYVEGYIAWASGRQSLLGPGHPYHDGPPN